MLKKMRFVMYISEKMILDIFEKKKWSEKGSDYEENYWIIELLLTKKRICEKKMKKKRDLWCVFHWKNDTWYFGKEEMEMKKIID